MKKVVLAFLFFINSYSFSNAQTDKTVVDAAASGSFAQVGDLLNQLSEGINPKAFNKDWKKTGATWADKAKGANDVGTLQSSLTDLVAKLKPKAFKPTWEKARDRWTTQVKNARTALALAGLTKTLYGNINPEMLTKDFVGGKAKDWLEMLSKVQ